MKSIDKNLNSTTEVQTAELKKHENITFSSFRILNSKLNLKHTRNF